MLRLIQKYSQFRALFQGLLALGIMVFLFHSVMHPNADSALQKLQSVFSEKVNQLESSLEEFSSLVNYGDELDVLWNNAEKFRNQGFDFFVFDKDTAVFWTTNQVAIQGAEVNNKGQEVLLLANGWYYKKTIKVDQFSIVGLFLIKNEYPYQNENLRNHFAADFDINFNAKIDKIKDGFPIYYPNGSFAFAVNEIANEKLPLAVEMLLFFGFIFALLKVIYGLWVLLKKKIGGRRLLLYAIGILATVLIRYFLYVLPWKSYISDFELLNPNLFASSVLTPTLADLIINVITFAALSEFASRILRHSQVSAKHPFWSLFQFSGLIALFYACSHWLTAFVVQMITNSDVPLDYYNFMSLTAISFLFLLLFFVILAAYFRFSTALFFRFRDQIIPQNKKGFHWFFWTALYLIFEILEEDFFSISYLIPAFLALFFIFFETVNRYTSRFTQIILVLVTFALYLSVLLNSTLNRKELAVREVYAKKIISEKELETEMEYDLTAADLLSYERLIQFFRAPDLTKITDLKRLLERKFFQGYWSRYYVDFHFYDRDTMPIATYVQIQDDVARNYERIINNVGIQSEVNANMYYVSDFSRNLSYIIRQPILDASTDTLGYLYLGLRSKIIPQETGFPRLLLDEESKVFFKLENYNMAKYVQGKLALHYGSFNYPRAIGSFLIDFPQKSGVIYDKEDVHLVSHGEQNKTIILSKQRIGFEEYLTTFSFFFATFGILIILMQIITGQFSQQWKTIKLAFRIQLLFIALVFFALLFSGLGTGTYVKRQYLEYQEDQLREKISSVQKELMSKLAYEENINDAIFASYLEFILIKFSGVFVTDINLYSTKGNLLASTRPEVFNLGLLSPQMNPEAFRNMHSRHSSLFVKQENIGNQDYLSAYVPLTNASSEVIAYINLPYFAKQNEFENEIAGFLSAIINIFVLLLALSVVIAVFVSSKIVDPLKKIQSSLSAFKLGKSQTPITYRANDEIGVLVNEYNNKLRELQESSEKLARSERELAWREMAKQVAHEIKNPLTPMRLRIQHFQRSFNPNDDDAQEQLEKFSGSLIEQIDTLTNIANAFSNFAKMPKTQFEKVDLVPLVRRVVDTFSAEEHVELRCLIEQQSILISADKELILRALNNLIKNGIQAIPSAQEGLVEVELEEKKAFVVIKISDNGSGVPEEMVDKIFVPNFTTKSTGTGLGLAMVKQIVESHQGQISFTSVAGKTVFTLILPKQQKNEA